MWCCTWERGLRGNNATCSALYQLSVTLPATHKQTGPFWCLFPGELSCEAGSFSCCHTPPQVFSVTGFEALFPLTGTVGCAVCLTPQFFLLVYLHTNVRLPGLPATTLPESSPSQLPVFPLLLVWINVSSLGSIFWQFWLFFVFKFVVVLLLVV